MGRKKRRRNSSPFPVQERQPNPSLPGPNSLIAAAELFSGPLPKPEILQKYNEVLPGLADRILVMAEPQAQHRQGLERKMIATRARNESLGQIFAFIISLVFGAGAFWLIYTGKSGEGLGLLVTEIAALAAVFIYGRKRQEKELAEKREMLAGRK